MRVSKKFLNDYIDIENIDFTEIADKMVFLGNEYDSLSKMSSATDLVVGKVLTRNDHPDSDKLNVCKVDIGDGKVYQIVCGAPNVDAGQLVIVAKIGATLPGDLVIKKTVIRGVDSNGMICSMAELGLNSKFLSQEDIDNIHVLPTDAIIGEDAIAYLGLDDEVIEFDITADRSDLLSILGMAYEVGAIYGLDVNYPEIQVDKINKDINDEFKLSVSTDNCSLYYGGLVENLVIGESPSFIKNRLIASDIRPINNVVDISNYIMLETGQPLHFFDADKLGKNIGVRMATDGEKFVTLDSVERNLTDKDIVVVSDDVPVALAGVMGGLDTEVTKQTTRILIESAIFKPTIIRNTSKRILRSEGSSRFEKGVSNERSMMALERAFYLLNKYASGEVATGTLKHDTTNRELKEIEITLNKINSTLGMGLSTEEVIGSFNKLKLDVVVKDDLFKVVIPLRRMDLNIPADIIEEVGRIIGYENLEGILPVTKVKRGSYTTKMKLIKDLRPRLEGLGMKQVLTYSLINEEESTKFVNDIKELVYLNDPISIDRSIMRNSLINSLLNVYNYNNARNIKDINIFEIGSCYYKEDSNYVEETKLSGLLSGTYIENKWQNKNIQVDFYLVKGIIENILEFIGLNNRYSFKANSKLKDMHPGRSATIIVGRDEVGFLGEVHPNMSKKPTYVFELNIDKLLSLKIRNIKFKELNRYPSMSRDLALITNDDIMSEQLENIIRKTSGRLLVGLDVFDVYKGDNVEEGKKSIAYTLVFRDPSRTLNDGEVNEIIDRVINKLEKELGAVIRSN